MRLSDLLAFGRRRLVPSLCWIVYEVARCCVVVLLLNCHVVVVFLVLSAVFSLCRRGIVTASVFRNFTFRYLSVKCRY